MKRLLTIIGAVGMVLGVEAAVSSRSYVQRGLAAQYDGINNVGHDVSHDSTAKVWKDLTDNGNDGTCESSSCDRRRFFRPEKRLLQQEKTFPPVENANFCDLRLKTT